MNTWEVIDIDYIVVIAFPTFPDHIKIKKAKTLQEKRHQYVKSSLSLNELTENMSKKILNFHDYVEGLLRYSFLKDEV